MNEVQRTPFWKRGVPVPMGLWMVYIVLVIFGGLSLWNRDYAFWWLVGPIVIFVAIGILFLWGRRHPDESRRRAAAGYPLANWIDRRRARGR